MEPAEAVRALAGGFADLIGKAPAEGDAGGDVVPLVSPGDAFVSDQD